MMLAQADRPIARISTQPEQQFTIKATGKAFRILSSGLYRDKMLAIVRELSCNAYDAHIAAGRKHVPFDIHLPNALEPFFSVRDYGTALSPHQITTVFTTYFESTKTNDNDQIGGLGLGCKSPLSYVDSFTVTSRLEGIKRVYTIFFDEVDTPCISLMTEEPTDEATGLEVMLSVKRENFREFKDRAEEVFRFFDVDPNVTGNPDYKLKRGEIMLKGDGYDLCAYDGNARAVMGVVAYPINAYSVGVNGIGQTLLNSTLRLHVGVGDLGITAGREELSYDPKTKEVLNARLKAVLSDIPRKVIREFRQCKTEYEARKLYGRVVNNFQVVKALFPEGKVPFRGQFINSNSFPLDLKKDYPKTTFLQYDFGYSKTRHTTHSGDTYRDSDRLNIRADDDLRMVIDDLNGRETNSRIRQFREDNPEALVYVVRTHDPEELARLMKRLEGAQFHVISSLPKSPVTPRQPTRILKLGDFEKRSGSFNNTSWQGVTVEPSEVGVYIGTSSGAIHDDRGERIHNFSDLYRLALTLKLFDPLKNELYSIPKTLAKNFVDADGWDNFFSLVREEFSRKLVNENWEVDLAAGRSVKAFSEKHPTYSGEKTMLNEITTKLNPDHQLVHFFNKWESCLVGRDCSKIISMAEKLGIALPTPVETDLVSLWEKVGPKYPMLQYMFSIQRWNRREANMIKDAVAYIETVDSRTNCITTAA